MAFVVLPHLLRARYGHEADRMERSVEFVLIVVVMLSCTASSDMPLQWPGAVAAAFSMSVIAVQTLAQSWHAWSQPPISADSKQLYRDFFLATLLSGPGLLTLAFGLVYFNAALMLPALACILVILAVYPRLNRLPKSIARVHTPRLHGVQALAELKALRSHALSQSLPYGVLFMCLGQVMAWGSSMLFPLVAWFLAGISFGLAAPIIYREKDDVPIAFIRAQVGFRETVSYLHLGIPLVFTAVAAAGISKQPAFGVAALFTALAAYFLGGRVDIVPAGAHTLRYRSAAPTPTILLEMLVLLVLLGVWWLFFFALSLLP